jgi:hypothetical protein
MLWMSYKYEGISESTRKRPLEPMIIFTGVANITGQNVYLNLKFSWLE